MEITPKNDAINIDAYVNNVNEKQDADKTSDKPDKIVTKGDTVAISETAKQIQEAKKQLEDIPDVRADKVAELKAQIENNTYEIKSEEIAEKMLNESLINDLF
jgi:negative regulator of flagellin synthesis FlgM